MDITLRDAAEDDLPLLLRFTKGYYEHDHIPFDAEDSRAALRELLAQPELGQVWIICQAGEAVGYAVLCFGYSLEFRGRDAFLDEIYIEPAHRGRGLGTRALQLLEQAARSRGIRAIHLEVERANTDGQRFYRAQGFTDRSRFFLMSKHLDRA